MNRVDEQGQVTQDQVDGETLEEMDNGIKSLILGFSLIPFSALRLQNKTKSPQLPLNTSFHIYIAESFRLPSMSMDPSTLTVPQGLDLVPAQ